MIHKVVIDVLLDELGVILYVFRVLETYGGYGPFFFRSSTHHSYFLEHDITRHFKANRLKLTKSH